MSLDSRKNIQNEFTKKYFYPRPIPPHTHTDTSDRHVIQSEQTYLQGALPHHSLIEINILTAPAGDGLGKAAEFLEVGLV